MGETAETDKPRERTVRQIFPRYPVGMFFQVTYFVVAILVLVIPFSVDLVYQDIQMDFKDLFMIEFRPCYYAGKYIDTIFTGVEIFFNPFENGFRYFPITTLLYAWCNLVTYYQACLIYTVMIFVSNLVTSAYIGKLVKNDYGLLLGNIYLSTPIHLMLMFAGNTSSFAAMFLIIGFYFLKKHRLFSAGIAFGLAILFKPLLLCVVPFLIVIKNRKIAIKDSIRQLAGVVLLLLPNLLIFVVNPAIFQAFISVNFGGPLNPFSNSISIPIGFVLNIPPGTVFWVLFLSLEILLFIAYYFRRDGDELEYFKISVFLALSTFVGSWMHYYLFYAAFANISFSVKRDNRMINMWIHLMYWTPWQQLLSILTVHLPIWSLLVFNLVVSIPYMITLVVEYIRILTNVQFPRFAKARPGAPATWFHRRTSNSIKKSTVPQQEPEQQLVQEG